MDQNPQRNLPPTNNSYEPQYHWFSPLPDAQLDTFNPSPAPRPEDDPFPNMDPELFTVGIANTLSRTDPSPIRVTNRNTTGQTHCGISSLVSPILNRHQTRKITPFLASTPNYFPRGPHIPRTKRVRQHMPVINTRIYKSLTNHPHGQQRQ
jgi:hypothetical protein